MRQLFRANFKFRSNPILLNYGTNFHQFTFLQTQLPKINPSTFYQADTIILRFVQKLNSFQQNLIQLQNYDFTESDLKELNLEDFSKNDNVFNSQKISWTKNRQNIKLLSDDYQNLKRIVQQKLSSQNIIEHIPILANLNCIDIKIWQKIVAFVAFNYKKSNLDQRLIMILGLSEYLKKFQFCYNLNKKPAFKFMFPQSYIIDLIQFRSFFRCIQNSEDFIRESDSEEDEIKKLQLLQSQIYLIMKATKKADMNIYIVRDFFEKRTQQMIKIASKHNHSPLHRRLLYNIYFIYSYLNFNDDKFFQQIEKYYFKDLKETMQDNFIPKNLIHEVSNKSKQMNKILSIWKLNKRPNLEIYYQLIRPFLRYILDNNIQKAYYSNISINLLMAGIKDHQIIKQMVQKCDHDKFKQDEFTHVIKHYLNIIEGHKNYQSVFVKCQSVQNPKIVKFLQRNGQKIFSTCLEIKGNLQTRRKLKSIQHHRVEKIWSDIIKKTFEHQYEVIQNATICNYQIDFLVLGGKKIIAIEVQGGHYSKKEFLDNQNMIDRDQNVVPTGKKEIKELILKAYGIKTVNIHCQQKIPTYVMQSRSLQLGVKYLKQKIAQQIGVQTVDL